MKPSTRNVWVSIPPSWDFPLFSRICDWLDFFPPSLWRDIPGLGALHGRQDASSKYIRASSARMRSRCHSVTMYSYGYLCESGSPTMSWPQVRITFLACFHNRWIDWFGKGFSSGSGEGEDLRGRKSTLLGFRFLFRGSLTFQSETTR